MKKEDRLGLEVAIGLAVIIQLGLAFSKGRHLIGNHVTAAVEDAADEPPDCDLLSELLPCCWLF